LAKGQGADAAAIRALEKPSLAAWAVNQLYWHRRSAYTRLIAAAEVRRAAHAKRLKGKGGDVDDAERKHSVALRDAANEIRALLADAGNDPTSATMNAVTETLQALPSLVPPGRLTEPLKLVGFEALAGLVPTSERTLRALAPPPAPAPPARKGESTAADHRHEAQQKKREAETLRRELAATKKALSAASREARQAETAVEASRRALAATRQERDRLQDQLQFAVKKIDSAAGDLREREARLAAAKQEVARLEEKLRIY
jgi:hypothetical protein